MYVVGAKNTKEIRKIRDMVPDSYLLIPGVGVQGGNMAEICRYGLDKNLKFRVDYIFVLLGIIISLKAFYVLYLIFVFPIIWILYKEKKLNIFKYIINRYGYY